jgi:hypothetical protein
MKRSVNGLNSNGSGRRFNCRLLVNKNMEQYREGKRNKIVIVCSGHVAGVFSEVITNKC